MFPKLYDEYTLFILLLSIFLRFLLHPSHSSKTPQRAKQGQIPHLESGIISL